MNKIYYSVFIVMCFFTISSSYARVNCSSLGGKWINFSEGACQININILSNGERYKVSGFVFDMRKYQIELVGANNTSYFSDNSKIYNYTVNELIQQLQGSNVVVSSIGYPRSVGEHLPRGLLQIKGNVLSELSLDAQTKKYLTAILCFDEFITPENTVATAPLSYFVGTSSSVDTPWKTNKCDNAVQVGPRIIEKASQPLITKERYEQANDRITLSIGSDYYVYLLHWEEMTLKGVQDILLSKQLGKSSSPLWAINISLRDIAGIATKNTKIGETDSTNSSFLIFTPRKN